MAHSAIARLTAMSARGRRASSEDHQRPEQVEVLLDGERPEVVEVGEGPVPVLGDVDVDGVEPSPGLAVHQVVERRPPQQRDQRGHEEDERQHAVVEREDAQEAPHVEVAEVVRLVAGVVENAGDEEAGQDEEQLDAVGPVVGHADDGALDPVGRQHVADEVEQQDHQDGQAPHPVQHRQVSTQVGPRAGTRREPGRAPSPLHLGWTAASRTPVLTHARPLPANQAG